MKFQAIQERTSYLLANPQEFYKPRYDVEILPLNYPELGELMQGVETLRENEMLGKRFIDLKDTELPIKIGLCGAAGGAGSLGIGAAAGASSLLINSELTKRILVVVAKSFGVTGVAGIIVAGYVTHCILEKSQRELDNYERDAKFVAVQMIQSVQGRQIEIQGCAIGAHLQLTAQQELKIARQETKTAQIERQQQDQQQLLSDREHEVTDLRSKQQDEIAALREGQQQKIDDLSDRFNALLARVENQV